MTVKDGDFIMVDYTERTNGTVVFTTDEKLATENDIYDEQIEYGPRLIVVGSRDVAEGFKEELIDKEIGHSGSVEVPHEKAYGAYDPGKVNSVPLNKFKDDKPGIGMRASIDGKMCTITRVIGRKVRVDYNHPLAGKTIEYDYTIRELIEDRGEKLKGLIKIFSGMNLEVEIVDGDVAEVDSPWEMGLYQKWPMIKQGVANMAMHLLDLKEVRFIETHKPEPQVTSQVISPPQKETTESAKEAAEEKEDALNDESGEQI